MENRLAYATACKVCSYKIFVARCRDGFWRPFDTNELPAGLPGTWAWRKRQGMEETDLVPGHAIHHCYGAHRTIESHMEYVSLLDLPVEPPLETLPAVAPPLGELTIPLSHETYLPSPDEIENARSVGGGWSQATLAAWGVPWPPPKGWRQELERRWQETHSR